MKTDNTLLWTLGITVAVIVLYYYFFYNTDTLGVVGEVTQTVNDAINIVRGNRLTHCPYDKTTGLVPRDPSSLADSCGLDLETYSLARAISSEEGVSTADTKIAVGWAIKNAADQKYGGSITTLVCTGDGYYGIQKLVGYCSTAQDPYDGDAQVAAGILGGTIADTTGGATQFDRPKGENAAKVQSNRIASGAVQTNPTGDITPGLEFWANGRL